MNDCKGKETPMTRGGPGTCRCVRASDNVYTLAGMGCRISRQSTFAPSPAPALKKLVVAADDVGSGSWP